MRSAKRTRIVLCGTSICLLTVLTGACNPNENPDDSNQQTYEITTYQTLTPSPVHTIDPIQLEPSAFPTASPTPFIYTVVANDTLIGIATRFNVALEGLIAANPGLDPDFLIIGSDLLIPAGEGTIGEVLPTPTPVGVTAHQPRCYPTASGGLWCLLLVNNDQSFAVENLAADILLLNSSDEVVASQQAFPLINRVLAGSSIPLVTMFESTPSSWEYAEALLLSAISVPLGDSRYLDAEIQNLQIEITFAGDSATIGGELFLALNASAATSVWVLAVAYDAEGNPVAVRRWDSSGELTPGESLRFALDIYSLGPPMTHVEILFEVRP